MSKPKKLPRLYRTVAIDLKRVPVDPSAKRAADDDDEVLYDIAISSEFEVERRGWFGDRWVEILKHDKDSIDLRRFDAGGIAFLKDHVGRDVIGITTDPTIGPDKTLRGKVRFSRSSMASEVRQDIDDAIRIYTSVGYDPIRARMVEERDGQEVWHITRWQPMEVSSVGIPADYSVGMNRSAAREEYELHDVEIEEDGTAVREEEPMSTQVAPPAGPDVRVVSPGASPPAAPDPHEVAAEIATMGEAYGMQSRVADWLRRGLTPDQVALEIHRARKTSGFAQPAAEALDLSPRERKRYSYAEAIRGAINLRDGKVPTGFAWDIHQELEKFLPSSVERHGGMLIPLVLDPERAQRALDSKTAGKGTELVFDTPGELIEVLRTKTFVLQRGAQILTGLTTPVVFPKQTSDMTVYWMGENPPAAVTESDVGTGFSTLAPKTMMGAGRWSRQLFMQASIDIEAMVRNSLGASHARAIDRIAVHGKGAASEPMGIYYSPDVQVKAMGGVPDYGKLVDMTTLVAEQDADAGALGFMTTPGMAGKLRQVLESATAGAKFIWTGRNDNGEIVGYSAVATNQILKTLGAGSNEHGLVYGNWGDLIIGLWGVIEIIVDPYTLAGQAMIKITSFQMGDVLLRHGQSFCKATGATVS